MSVSLPRSDPDQTAIIQAAELGRVDTVRDKLDDKPTLIWTRSPRSGDSLLHLSVISGSDELLELLLRRGAHPDVANNAGWKPLATAAVRSAAAASASLRAARLLLDHGADADSLNLRLGQSALHMCASNGSVELARMLLDAGAQVSIADIDGETPLWKAVATRNADVVRILLEHGAETNVRSVLGVTLYQVARADAEMRRLLTSAHVLRGPRVSGLEDPRRPARAQTLVALQPVPQDDWNKMVACHAFKASVVEFYIGEVEERIERTMSVYDLVYGPQGGGNREPTDKKPDFRWFHFPALNMEWVEALVRRRWAEPGPRRNQFTETVASDLGIRRTRNEHYLMPTSKGTFIRPFCRETTASPEQLRGGVGRHIGAFIPYLHYEVQNDFKVMSQVEAEVWNSDSLPRRPHRSSDDTESEHPDSRHGAGSAHSTANEGGGDSESASPSGLLHKILLQGYLRPGPGGEVPPLQTRRTLDHYFYSHLASTSRRDSDQVVQRYTADIADIDAKMFMVDQLWLWVLDDETVVSCCSLRWDSWDMQPGGGPTGDANGPPVPRSHNDFVLRPDDPLNIHQAISRILRSPRRDSITNAQDLCRVIASACLNAFDHHETPDEFHFFDFVEHAIGQVMDKTAERFQEFQVLLDAAAATNELLSATSIRIEQETKLLGEIEDIRDELGVLRLVLDDQKRVAKELDLLLSSRPVLGQGNETDSGRKYSLQSNRVLDSHLMRIGRMEVLTARSIQSIRSLLKLKQQHASLSEAHSARRQAEYTSRQAHVATSYNKKVADQLDLARKQAEETAKQGNVILVFTVVTVVFLPLSFMTSFFSIDIAEFPVDKEGRLPLGTILGIIMGVSAGVSIPFILLAFNLQAVIKWYAVAAAHMKKNPIVLAILAVIIAITVVALAVILSQPLAQAIKTGVGIGIGLLALIPLGLLTKSLMTRSRDKL